jgi:hypothetical protein
LNFRSSACNGIIATIARKYFFGDKVIFVVFPTVVSKNARQLGLRLDERDAARLAAFERTGVEGVSLARAALQACLNFFEEHGYLSLPLEIQPHSVKQAAPSSVKSGPASKSTATSADSRSTITPLPPQHLAAAEESAPYRTRRSSRSH